MALHIVLDCFRLFYRVPPSFPRCHLTPTIAPGSPCPAPASPPPASTGSPPRPQPRRTTSTPPGPRALEAEIAPSQAVSREGLSSVTGLSPGSCPSARKVRGVASTATWLGARAAPRAHQATGGRPRGVSQPSGDRQRLRRSSRGSA